MVCCYLFDWSVFFVPFFYLDTLAWMKEGIPYFQINFIIALLWSSQKKTVSWLQKRTFKCSHCCDHCYSSSQDEACIREHYHEREERLSEVLVTLGGRKQPAWKERFVEHFLLMVAYQPSQLPAAKTCYSLQMFGEV